MNGYQNYISPGERGIRAFFHALPPTFSAKISIMLIPPDGTSGSSIIPCSLDGPIKIYANTISSPS